MQFDICVIVAIYNSTYDDLLRTINSIINQKDVCFEFILANDCSTNDSIDRIDNYLKEMKISNYSIVNSEENVGTVLNIYNALKHTDAKYIKSLGQGDCLSNDYALRDIVEYISENNLDFIIHDYSCFKIEKENIITIKYKVYPDNCSVYNSNNYIKMLKYHILYSDSICGISTAYRRDIILNYLKILNNRVIYTEDFITSFALIDNRKCGFLNEILVNYKIGDGISTKKEISSAFKKDITICNNLAIDYLKEISSTHKLNENLINRLLKRLEFNNEHLIEHSRKFEFYYYLNNLDVLFMHIKHILFSRKSKT